jgi:predicted phage terminase large subunit-like protein
MTNAELHDPQSLAGDIIERDPIHVSLIGWTTLVLGQSAMRPASHHRLLLGQLEAICHGEIDRLMVLMPPGSAKSTYTSILFTPWWFTQRPNSSVITTTHTRSLAEDFGRQTRDLILEHGSQLGYGLRAGDRAAGHWRTSTRGDYFASGIRGPLIGRRADLVIIDDPIKSHAEADSPVMRARLWDWYRADLITRLKPNGRVVLIMTRWHEDDLAGRLLAQNEAEWKTICLPAVAQDNDSLGRVQGSALWPEWEDATALLRKRDTVGERTWSAVYQQCPRPLQGSLFKTACIGVLDTPQSLSAGRVVRAWDLAATVATGGNDPDWTVGIKLARDTLGQFTVLDVVRLRGSPREVETAIFSAAHIDGRSVGIGLPEDPGQAGKAQVSYLVRGLAGHRITATPETGAKTTRAAPVASQVEAGNLNIVRAGWNHAFLDELRDFPFGRKDDQVDALSRAFRMLTASGPPMRKLSVSYLSR